MKRSYVLVLGAFAIPLFFAGCKDNASKTPAEKPDAVKGKMASVNPGSKSPNEEGEVRMALAKLGAEDRHLAEAQGFCPRTGKTLGSMGTPVKVLLKGKPVFVCCEGCEEDARQHADQMLAKVEELKSKAKAAPVEK